MTRPAEILRVVLLVNGAYDLICACSILWLETLPVFNLLSTLHTTMFVKEDHVEHPVIRRLLSYWVFTYGTIRIAAGVHPSPTLTALGALSYFIEALFFQHEDCIGGTMDHTRVRCVVLFSMAIGLAAAFIAIENAL